MRNFAVKCVHKLIEFEFFSIHTITCKVCVQVINSFYVVCEKNHFYCSVCFKNFTRLTCFICKKRVYFINKQRATSNVICRLENCAWRGMVDVLYEHCEKFHSKLIVMRSSSVFETSKPSSLFLLVGDEGLYWLHVNYHMRDLVDECILTFKGEINSIGSSPPLTFNAFLKFQMIMYKAVSFPEFIADCRRSINYSPANQIIFMTIKRQKSMDKVEEKLGFQKKKICRNIQCSICLENINTEKIINCEMQHFLCYLCFDHYIKINSKKLRCPVCKGLYLYDCESLQ